MKPHTIPFGDILYDTDCWVMRPSSRTTLAGPEAHDRELSIRRAESVSSSLSGRQLNRRVEIRINAEQQ